jgi:transcriptional regulator with XRE-family HTH domain
MHSYAHELGARLRSIRLQQGLSLQGVEARSVGRWKAVVIGSYERGDRAISVARLAELADFYRVPLSRLVTGGPGTPSPVPAGTDPRPPLVIDLERLATVSAAQVEPLRRYVGAIQDQRGDYNGRVLTVRRDDLRVLAAALDATPAELTARLDGWGLLRGRDVPAELEDPSEVVRLSDPAG